jgi:hypothetical protein
MTFAHRHAVGIVVAAATLIGGAILLYRVSPLTAIITSAFGSTAIALIVLAHVGVIAALLLPLLAWRRRLRR